MKLFKVNMPEATAYCGTRKEAHDFAKDQPKNQWCEITIDEVDVQCDKEGMIHALNGVTIEKIIKTYGLTARGGLKEE